MDRQATCPCGSVQLELLGEPLGQVYCHCDDCQRAHGAAYVPRAIYPRDSVRVVKGRTASWINRVRTMVICAECGSHLYGEHAEHPFRGVNAGNFGPGEFEPSMHLHCKFALAPVVDNLRHYLNIPLEYGGTGALADW